MWCLSATDQMVDLVLFSDLPYLTSIDDLNQRKVGSIQGRQLNNKNSFSTKELILEKMKL